MTNSSDALRVVVGLAEKATPGVWEVSGDDQGHPLGLEWSIYSPENADEDYTGWVAGEDGGDGIATTGCPGFRADAETIAAAVNFIREHGAALAQALENDARYRWLRDKSFGQREHPIAVSQRMAPFNTMQYIGPLAGESLDAAIDAAIAAQQKEAANGD